MATSTLSSKGQITLPQAIRKRLRLKPGDRIDFEVGADGEVRLRPLRSDIRALKGLLKRPGRKPVSLEEMEEAIRRGGEA
jgi:AbrB family looped-hinge helix DNA binding protein